MEEPWSARRAVVLALAPATTLGVLALPAGMLDVARSVSASGAEETRLLVRLLATAGLAAVSAGVFAFRFRRSALTLPVAAWAAALVLAIPGVTSPQLSLVLLVELVLVAGLLAVAVRPSRGAALAHLVLASSGAAVLTAEIGSGLGIGAPPDYGDLYGPPDGKLFGVGGQLAPELDLEVVGDGPGGRVRFVSDSHGFRHATDVERPKPPGTFRAMFLGDSFFAGYRVDQEGTPGAVAARILAERAPEGVRVEAPIARLDDPAYAWLWLDRHGFAFEPDLVVLGIALGNDAAGCWLALHPEGVIRRVGSSSVERRYGPVTVGFTTEPMSEAWLPDAAFVAAGPLDALADRVRRLRVARPFRPGETRWGISTWYGDGPGRVHALDPQHGLGLYHRGDSALVDDALDALAQAIAGVAAACEVRGVPLVAVPIPQRFEVDDADWAATVERYHLDPDRFDRDRPRRRLESWLDRGSIPRVDLTAPFRAAAARGERLHLPFGDMHWNAAGARLAGETIAEALLPFGPGG